MSQHIDLKTGEFSITRGDNGTLPVGLYYADNDGNIVGDYEPNPNDTLTLTVKKTDKESDHDKLINKIIKATEKTFDILPENTAGLKFGKYFYDVELNTETNKTYTVVGPVAFNVLKEVGF